MREIALGEFQCPPGIVAENTLSKLNETENLFVWGFESLAVRYREMGLESFRRAWERLLARLGEYDQDEKFSSETLEQAKMKVNLMSMLQRDQEGLEAEWCNHILGLSAKCQKLGLDVRTLYDGIETELDLLDALLEEGLLIREVAQPRIKLSREELERLKKVLDKFGVEAIGFDPTLIIISGTKDRLAYSCAMFIFISNEEVALEEKVSSKQPLNDERVQKWHSYIS